MNMELIDKNKNKKRDKYKYKSNPEFNKTKQKHYICCFVCNCIIQQKNYKHKFSKKHLKNIEIEIKNTNDYNNDIIYIINEDDFINEDDDELINNISELEFEIDVKEEEEEDDDDTIIYPILNIININNINNISMKNENTILVEDDKYNEWYYIIE